MKKQLLFFMLALLILPIVQSQDMQSLGNQFKKGECVNLVQTCNNCTYVNVTKVLYPNSTIAVSSLAMTKEGTFYSVQFCNTNETGTYIYNTLGDPDGILVTQPVSFEVTTTGTASTIQNSIFYFGLVLIMIFFIGLAIFTFARFDNLLNRIGMLGVIYLLIIAISFIGWQMSTDFLSSYSFITSMMYYIFFILMIGFFPMVIGGFAFYVLSVLRINEINRLMEKGFSLEEAEHRTRRKK